MIPIRIQRKRTKGFRLQEQSPDGAPVVSVARPGKWSNPFKSVGDQIFIHAGYRRIILDPWVFVCGGNVSDAARLFELTCEGATNTILREYGVIHHVMYDIHYHMERLRLLPFHELKGKHIACFCAVGEPCHGDYILKRSNQ